VSISRHDVEKVAHLARLAVTEENIAATTERLGNVLAMVDQLQAVNTDGIAPLAHPLDRVQRLRQDMVTETNQRELLMENAKRNGNAQDGLFLVPKVIE